MAFGVRNLCSVIEGHARRGTLGLRVHRHHVVSGLLEVGERVCRAARERHQRHGRVPGLRIWGSGCRVQGAGFRVVG